MAHDDKGWYWYEKASIRVSWCLFLAMEKAVRTLLWFRLPAPWLHKSKTWIWLAGEAYLIDDLKRHDMPDHHRIGGIWA